eukprot:c11869_g1_i1.p1 GENE.c11869_g1_i1~~c11869_g1_i1.p1  ORF type:complete len:688 (+),score=157.56 c11869_g1_i1:103-2166(+)
MRSMLNCCLPKSHDNKSVPMADIHKSQSTSATTEFIETLLSKLRAHLVSKSTPNSNIPFLAVSFLNKEYNLETRVDVLKFISQDPQETAKLISNLAVTTQRAASLFKLEATLLNETLTNLTKQIEVTRVNKPQLMTQTLYDDQFVKPLLMLEQELQYLLNTAREEHAMMLRKFRELREKVTKPIMTRLQESRLRFETAFLEIPHNDVQQMCQLGKQISMLPLAKSSPIKLHQTVDPDLDVQSPECLRVIYEQANVAHSELGRVLDQIVDNANQTHREMSPLKSLDRALEKAIEEYQGDFSRILDITRGSIVCEHSADMIVVLQNILNQATNNRLKVLRIKNRFDPSFAALFESGGYRDILFNLEVCGHVCEIQIQLTPLAKLKKGGSHLLYSRARSLHLLDSHIADVRVTDKSELSSVLDRVSSGTCQMLHLDNIDLETPDCERIRDGLLSEACFVHTISLSGSSITGEKCDVFSRGFGAHNVFKNVQLFNNPGISGKCVSVFISPSLEVLDLLDCNLDFDNTLEVCQALARCKPKRLKELSLGGCNLKPQGAKILCDCLVQAANITALDLYKTGLGSLGGEAIAEAVSSHPFLTSLNLANNALGDEGILHICKILENSKSITTLDLGSNGVSDQGYKHIAKSISLSATITSLNLQTEETSAAAKTVSQVLESNRRASQQHLAHPKS